MTIQKLKIEIETARAARSAAFADLMNIFRGLTPAEWQVETKKYINSSEIDPDEFFALSSTLSQIAAAVQLGWIEYSRKRTKIQIEKRDKKLVKEAEELRKAPKKTKGAKLSNDAKRIKIFVTKELSNLPFDAHVALIASQVVGMKVEQIQAALKELRK